MLQYLIIILDDTSVSYCHYENPLHKSRLISIENLKSAIIYAMKQNLMVQYILPDYSLPAEYIDVMNMIDSHIFVSSTCEDNNATNAADVIIFNDWIGLDKWKYSTDKSYVLRTSKEDFFDRYRFLRFPLSQANRINVVFTDIECFTEQDFSKYELILTSLLQSVKQEYLRGHYVQLNLLTDRLVLKKMNNCNAGVSNITLAPNGNFYICPAFYYDECAGLETEFFGKNAVGSLSTGIDIMNPDLYRQNNAPICRNCDAFHCKRCVWLNRKMTLEVNTPSHEQCVTAHLERNASRILQGQLASENLDVKHSEIKEINYTDPFDIRNKWWY